jgi:hypothetical protein
MTTARQQIEQEMVNELLARRNSLTAEKEQLQAAAQRLTEINGKLTVIKEELQAYGYVEDPSTGIAGDPFAAIRKQV